MARHKRRKKHRKMSEALPLSARRRRRGKSVATGKKRKRRKSGLSEMFSPNTAMQAAKGTLSGVVGGGIAGLINDVMPDTTKFGWRLGGGLVASFLLTGLLNAPKMGAGVAGATGLLLYLKLREGNLQEGYDYANPNVLSEYPSFMDEAGNPMYLSDDGNLYYLEEGETVNAYDEALSAGNPLYLSDDEDQLGIYPNYVNASNY